MSVNPDCGYAQHVYRALEGAEAFLLGQTDNYAKGYLVVASTGDLKRHLNEMIQGKGCQIPEVKLSESVQQLTVKESFAYRTPVWCIIDSVLFRYSDSLHTTPESRAQWFLEILNETDSYQLNGKDLTTFVSELKGTMEIRARKKVRNLYSDEQKLLDILRQVSQQFSEGDTFSGRKLKEKALNIIQELIIAIPLEYVIVHEEDSTSFVLDLNPAV